MTRLSLALAALVSIALGAGCANPKSDYNRLANELRANIEELNALDAELAKFARDGRSPLFDGTLFTCKNARDTMARLRKGDAAFERNYKDEGVRLDRSLIQSAASTFLDGVDKCFDEKPNTGGKRSLDDTIADRKRCASACRDGWKPLASAVGDVAAKAKTAGTTFPTIVYASRDSTEPLVDAKPLCELSCDTIFTCARESGATKLRDELVARGATSAVPSSLVSKLDASLEGNRDRCKERCATMPPVKQSEADAFKACMEKSCDAQKSCLEDVRSDALFGPRDRK